MVQNRYVNWMHAQKFALFTILFTLLVTASPASAVRGPQSFTYEGRLYDDLGNPSLATVTFKVQVLDEQGSCTLYEESFVGKDLSATKGLFSLSLGTGLASPGYLPSLAEALRNDVGSHTLGSCPYSIANGDGRKVRIVVDDGSTDSALAPLLSIGAAAYAMNANELEGKRASDFLLVDEASNLNQTKLSSIFTGTGYSTLQDLVSGKFLRDSATGGVQLPSYAADPSGPTAGSIWYDSTNQVLKYRNGSATVSLDSGVSSITAGDGLSGGTITTSGTIALRTIGAAGSGTKINYDTYGRVTGTSALAELDLPSLSTPGKVSGNAVTSGQIGGSTSVSTTGNIQTSNDLSARRLTLFEAGLGPAGVTLTAPASGTTSYTLTLPPTAGTSGQVLTTSGSGALSWSTPSTGVTGVAPLSNGSIWIGDGSSRAQAVTINGDATISNSGTLTLATVPVNKGGTGLTTRGTANQVLGVNAAGTALEYKSITAGSGITITPTAGTVTIAATGSSTGSVTSVGVSVPSFMTSTGGPITSSGTIALGLSSQPANTVFAGPATGSASPTFRTLSIYDIRSSISGYFLTASGACSTGQTLTYSAVSDTLSCAAYSLTSSQVTTALGFTPVNKAGDTMTGALTVPTNGLTVGANDLLVTGGFVGIGTAAPRSRLDVFGTGDASAIIVPRDGTRPSTPINGMLRYNTGLNVLETFANGSWQMLAGAGTGAFLPLAGGTMSGPIDLGGQTLRGGSAASASLTLDSTSNATKGFIVMNPSGGNVGIGSTAPAYTLDVNGTAKATNVLIAGGSSSQNFTGTTIASSIQANNLADGGSALRIASASAAGLTNAQITGVNVSLSGSNFLGTTKRIGIQSSVSGGGFDSSTGTAAYLSAVGSVNNYGLIVANGFVGIGTVAPTVALDVAGTLKIGNGSESCVGSANGGMLRYESSTLRFCNGSSWQTLGQGLTSESDPTVQSFAKNAPSSDFTVSSNTLGLQTVATNKGGTGMNSIGGSNTLLGVNMGGTGLEYKSINAGTGISIGNTSGALTIGLTGSTGTVTSVSATSPLSVSNSTTTPSLSMTQATSSSNGYLSSSHWNTFNNKIAGSGTTNVIPKFTASNGIGDSQIQDANGIVRINGVSGHTGYLEDKLEVNGNIRARAIRGKAGMSATTWGNQLNFNWNDANSYLRYEFWVEDSKVGEFNFGSSDRRIKKDISTLAPVEGLSAINQLRPVSYHWRDPAYPDFEYGFIAQEVEEVLPKLVKNSGIKTELTPDGLRRIKYDGLFAPIVKAIQELYANYISDHARIAELERQNANLASKLEAQEARLKRLEDSVSSQREFTP